MKANTQLKCSIFSYFNEVNIHISAHLLFTKRPMTTMGV
jgi:hypothetical protein